MPYIITTKQTPTSNDALHKQPWTEVSRHAVAMPTEINAMCIEHGATGLTTAELRKIVNEGDTIGPLPDGTVIEVERVEWPALAKIAGKSWITYEPSSDHLREAIIDAYNKETA